VNNEALRRCPQILAVCATAKEGVPWTTVRYKFDIETPFGSTQFDSAYAISLYKWRREGRHDTHTDDHFVIDDDEFPNFRAFELNRGTTVLTLLVSFFVGAFYAFLACKDRRLRAGELLCGAAMLLASLLSFAGSGYWVERLRKNYFDDQFPPGTLSDKVECSYGCGLEIVAGVLCLVVAASIFALRPGSSESA